MTALYPAVFWRGEIQGLLDLYIPNKPEETIRMKSKVATDYTTERYSQYQQELYGECADSHD